MLKTAHDAEEFMRTGARVSPSWPGGDLRGRIRCSRLISRRSRQNPLQTGRAIRFQHNRRKPDIADRDEHGSQTVCNRRGPSTKTASHLCFLACLSPPRRASVHSLFADGSGTTTDTGTSPNARNGETTGLRACRRPTAATLRSCTKPSVEKRSASPRRPSEKCRLSADE
jgi:hypothetical protein